MSPVSRGRKGKKNKNKQVRQGVPAEPVVSSEDGADVDAEIGLHEMMDEVVARIAEFEHVDEPVDGEYLAAGLLAVGYGESADYAEVFARLFIDKAEELAEPGALAFLRCVAVLAPEPARTIASEAAARLAAAGVEQPEWVAELDTPVSAGEYVRWRGEDGNSAILFGTFERAGRADGFMVFIDDDNCGAAYDLAPLVEEGLAESRRQIDEQEPAPEEPMTADEFRWQVEAALEARALHDRAAAELGIEFDDDDDDDDAIPHEVADVVVRARLHALPMPGKPLPVHVHPEFV